VHVYLEHGLAGFWKWWAKLERLSNPGSRVTQNPGHLQPPSSLLLVFHLSLFKNELTLPKPTPEFFLLPLSILQDNQLKNFDQPLIIPFEVYFYLVKQL